MSLNIVLLWYRSYCRLMLGRRADTPAPDTRQLCDECALTIFWTFHDIDVVQSTLHTAGVSTPHIPCVAIEKKHRRLKFITLGRHTPTLPCSALSLSSKPQVNTLHGTNYLQLQKRSGNTIRRQQDMAHIHTGVILPKATRTNDRASFGVQKV